MNLTPAPQRPGAAMIVAFVVSAAIAGCLSSPKAPGENGATDDVDQAPFTPVALTFSEIPVPEGTIEIAAMGWIPHNATTAVLLIHGISGVKENFFHTFPEKGYDLGGALARTGRAAIAADMPGYGQSGGIRTGQPGEAGYGFDANAAVAAGLAEQLRSGAYGGPAFRTIIGMGISMGGATVDGAQGLHGSFDAIVPISATHQGLRPEYVACLAAPAPQCSDYQQPRDDFFLPNSDSDVINATLAGYEAPHAINFASYIAMIGSCSLPSCAPSRYDLNARNIDVPVLSILGLEDRLMNTDDASNEPSYFPVSPDAKVLVLEATGHMATHHLNHEEVVAAISEWLDKHEL